VLGEVAVDGGLEVDDGVEDATLEATLRSCFKTDTAPCRI
jgi:hypothetical protein